MQGPWSWVGRVSICPPIFLKKMTKDTKCDQKLQKTRISKQVQAIRGKLLGRSSRSNCKKIEPKQVRGYGLGFLDFAHSVFMSFHGHCNDLMFKSPSELLPQGACIMFTFQKGFEKEKTIVTKFTLKWSLLLFPFATF